MKLFLLAPILMSFSTAFAETGETYETHAPMPIATSEIAVVELDDKIYVIGGFVPNGKGSLDTVQIYDTKTDTWTMGSSMPKPLNHPAAATFDGKIYVVGGFEYSLPAIGAWLGTNYLFIYDPTSDTWIRGADMPTDRGALVADFLDGKLYAVGGKNVLSSGIMGTIIFKMISTPINEVYDPVTNSWEQKAPMPTPRDHIASAVVDEKMYVIGGRNAHRSNSLSANEVYDPKTNTWSVLEPMPTIRSGSTASVLNYTIFVFGGETDERIFNTNQQYIPNEGWITHANMTLERKGLGSATVGDKIYLLGGGPTLGDEQISLNVSYYNPQVIPEFNDVVMLLVLVSSFLFVIIFRQALEKINWNHKSLLNENSL